MLSEKAETYFNDVAYSLDYGDGKVATHSQVINHCLGELALFEKASGDQVTGWIKEFYPEVFEEARIETHLVRIKEIQAKYKAQDELNSNHSKIISHER